MPSRILREGILTSEPVNSLSPEGELFYRRLMSVVDDFGRYYGSPKHLRPACYPLQIDRISEAKVHKWSQECAWTQPPLVDLYTHDGKDYIAIRNFGNARATKSKFPSPPESICIPLQADAIKCAQTQTNVPYSYSDSSSDSSTGGKESDEKEGGFDSFWTAWPRHKRKEERDKCLAHWKTNSLAKIAVQIVASVNAWKASPDWQKEGGQFIPAPIVWLRKERWLSDLAAPSTPVKAVSHSWGDQ